MFPIPFLPVDVLREYYSRFHVDTLGGVVLYGMSFIMLLVPLAVYFFGAGVGRQSKSSKTKIAQIMIYPIKSCRGIRVSRSKLLRTGLDLDRNWMFVDANMGFLTIRHNSNMTLINTSITPNDELVADATAIDPAAVFCIPAHPTQEWLEKNTELKTVDIWKIHTDAWIYPEHITAPFRAVFGQEVRLARKGPTPRVLAGCAAPRRLGRTESARFPDVAPVTVANEKSIAELNSRLDADITIERFRQNIIVEGQEAWCEDTWKTLRLGDGGLTIDVTSRCGRCRVIMLFLRYLHEILRWQVPNVDPATGVQHEKEPFNTLMKFRRIDEGLPYTPCFGMLCVPRGEGDVFVGMTVEVTETTNDHKYISSLSS